MRSVAGAGTEVEDPLLEVREERNVAVVVITADRGLCGSLNTNIIRRATRFMLDEVKGAEPRLITVGKKGRDFMIRYGRPVVAEFINYGDRPKVADVIPIARVVSDEFAAMMQK